MCQNSFNLNKNDLMIIILGIVVLFLFYNSAKETFKVYRDRKINYNKSKYEVMQCDKITYKPICNLRSDCYWDFGFCKTR